MTDGEDAKAEGGAGQDAPRAWERESSERLEEYGMFGVRRDRVRSPRTGEAHEFEIADSPEGVTVIALTDDDRMVLVEQFRHPLRELSLETPSGVVDEGEPPLEAAIRELREETGFEGSAPEHLGTLVLNPSWQTTRVHVVVVRSAERRHDRDQDEGEDIRVRLVPRRQVVESILRGEIDSAVAVSAMALFEWRRGAGAA